MKWTFHMGDAWGDDYDLTVEADSETEAVNLANTADDDAIARYIVQAEE